MAARRRIAERNSGHRLAAVLVLVAILVALLGVLVLGPGARSTPPPLAGAPRPARPPPSPPDPVPTARPLLGEPEPEDEACAIQVELLRGQVARCEGTPARWSDDPLDAPEAVAEILDEILADPEIEVQGSLDCSEFPCLAILVGPKEEVDEVSRALKEHYTTTASLGGGASPYVNGGASPYVKVRTVTVVHHALDPDRLRRRLERRYAEASGRGPGPPLDGSLEDPPPADDCEATRQWLRDRLVACEGLITQWSTGRAMVKAREEAMALLEELLPEDASISVDCQERPCVAILSGVDYEVAADALRELPGWQRAPLRQQHALGGKVLTVALDTDPIVPAAVRRAEAREAELALEFLASGGPMSLP